MSFPPGIAYPLALDTDRTLFKVYNTTQSVLTADNPPWSREISIRPQDDEDCEIWADNGFATLSGELMYYGAVAKNADGKVYKLKKVLRNIGGDQTQYNKEGTPIYSFVIAEHHLQIVKAILNIEKFVGENFTDVEETLDWRIRNLFEEPIIFDDFSCPDVEFNFNIIESDPQQGVVANYFVNVVGSVDSFEVQFGDGTTSTLASGTHTYAPYATVDPSVVVTSQNCNMVQTPIEREEVSEPEGREPVPPFFVPVPLLPDLPPLFFPSIDVPSLDIFTPNIDFPCFSLTPISIGPIGPVNVPSIISFSPANPVPSQIDFGPAPTFSPVPFSPTPTFSPIPFAPTPAFPPIEFDTTTISFPSSIVLSIEFDNFPSCCSVEFAPMSCCEVSFAPPPSFAPVQFDTPPEVSVNWGIPPTISIVCPGASPMAARSYMDDYDNIEIEYDSLGFPTEIKVIPPNIPPIKVEMPEKLELAIPQALKELKEDGIKLVVPDGLISISLPSLNIDTSQLETIAIPVAFPDKMPEIRVTGIPDEIKVVGIPDTIAVVGIPDSIMLKAPEEIPLVFKGPPLTAEVKVTMDVQKLMGNEEGQVCVAIVPCRK